MPTNYNALSTAIALTINDTNIIKVREVLSSAEVCDRVRPHIRKNHPALNCYSDDDVNHNVRSYLQHNNNCIDNTQYNPNSHVLCRDISKVYIAVNKCLYTFGSIPDVDKLNVLAKNLNKLLNN